MTKIRVRKGKSKYARIYWPRELEEEGYIGEMLVLNDAMTATIIHPHASLEQAKESLQIVLKDLELRIKRGQRATSVQQP